MLVLPGPGFLALGLGLLLVAPELGFVRRGAVRLTRRFAPKTAPTVERTAEDIERERERGP